jgi:cellulose synthase/poly-beta-1,6-N-acetylglucosamine synthase-like glycosyltransferase
MELCENPTPRDGVSTWAFMVKNLVRPMGLSRLGLPVPLTGTGMAFPRRVIERVAIAGDSIVEDMQLGLDMAVAGYAPRLCPQARVTGQLPTDRNAALRQRRRWEHGHLRTLLAQVPRLIWTGFVRARPAAWAMALDLLVPPLSLLLLLMIMTGIALALVANLATASPLPAITIALATISVLGCVFLTWIKFGRRTLPASTLPAALAYVAWKIPMYFAFLFRPEKKWVRTARLPVSHKVVDHADDVEPVVH